MDSATINLAASMSALMHEMAGISHNLANVSSTAYKRRAGLIDSFEIELDRAGTQGIHIPAYIEFNDFRQGDSRTNGNPMNIAIMGPGFMQIENPANPQETLYTRVGTLARSAQGFLVTLNGHRILDPTGSPINVGQIADLQIRTTGEIISTELGNRVGSIGLVRFQNTDKLQSLGAGLYRQTEASGAAVIDRFTTVQQGSLERSNVEAISELIKMITVQRHYAAVARTLSTVSQTAASLNTLAQG